MAISLLSHLLNFFVSWLVSTIIIYVVTKLFGEKEGIGTALLAALIGAVAYSLSYLILGYGILGTFIGGVVWLLILKDLYSIGWIKSFLIALIVWILASLISLFLPTLTGPL